MNILKLTATFGCLKNETLDLRPGLNIIEAPNEAGKSTWCAFIRAMLYGLNVSERDRAGRLSEKTRYRPWDGTDPEGSMDITCRLGEITLQRTALGRVPMRALTAVHTGTGIPVDGLTAEHAGETLTGVPAAIFDRSAYIAQGGIPVSGAPELERRIAALVTSGDETVSYTEAEARLRAWLRARQHNKSGRIPAAESELAAIAGTLAAVEAAHERASALRRERDTLAQRAARLTAELDQAAGQDGADTEARLRSFRARGQAHLAEARAERDAAELAAQGSPIHGHDPVALTARVDAAAAEARGRSVPGPVWPIGAALLILLALAAIFFPGIIRIVAAGVLVLLLLGIIYWTHLAKRTRAALRDLLRPFGVPDAAALRRLADDYMETVRILRETEAACRRLAEEAQRADTLIETLPGRGTPRSEAAKALEETLGDTEAALREAETRYALHMGEARGLGDPLVLGSQRDALERELAALRAQYDAIALALEELSRAHTEIQTRVAPVLTKTAAGILRRLTEGRHEQLAFTADFEAGVKYQDDMIYRSTLALSSGAADQVYFALRLAVCALLLGGEDPCPLILDDALLHFDGGRARRALDYLLELAETRQVLLFTCHDRERRYLSARPDVNIVRLL